MARYRIRLELAPDHHHPEGDAQCGYQFEAPLDATLHLDPVAWGREPDGFPVVRFWVGEPDRQGRLILTDQHSWHFHYAAIGERDEPAFQWDKVLFEPGTIIDIRDHGRDMRVFRVHSVQPLTSVTRDTIEVE